MTQGEFENLCKEAGAVASLMRSSTDVAARSPHGTTRDAANQLCKRLVDLGTDIANDFEKARDLANA